MGSPRQGRVSALSALAVLALLIAGANLVGYSAANPYVITGEVPPDQETYPPVITVTSPVNNTAYNTSRVFLTFNVTALAIKNRLGTCNPDECHLQSRLVQGGNHCSQWRRPTASFIQSPVLKRA